MILVSLSLKTSVNVELIGTKFDEIKNKIQSDLIQSPIGSDIFFLEYMLTNLKVVEYFMFESIKLLIFINWNKHDDLRQLCVCNENVNRFKSDEEILLDLNLETFDILNWFFNWFIDFDWAFWLNIMFFFCN